MYIRLIDSTLRENEYLFRLNDQQKVYLCRYVVLFTPFNFRYGRQFTFIRF